MKIARSLAALLVSGLLPMAGQAATYITPSSVYYSTLGGVSRAQFVQMVLQETGSFGSGGTNCFTDVRAQGYASYICEAKTRGFITGNANGYFYPDRAITFVEASAIVVRARGSGFGGGSPWYVSYLQQMADWDAVPASVTNIFQAINITQAQDILNSVFNANNDNNNDNNNDDNNDDLRLTVTSSDNTVNRDETVTFRIKLENTGDRDLENIDVTAQLDNDMDFVSASKGGDEDDGEVTWDNVDVNEDETVTLLLTVRVDDNADRNDTLTLDVDAEDSSVSRSIRVGSRTGTNNDDEDLRLSITDSDDPVEPGDTLTYKITLDNRGNDDISVDVNAFLDNDVDFVSASDDGDENRDEVQWDNINVDADDEVTLTLRVRVKNAADDGDELELRVEANGEEDTERTEVDDNGSGCGSDCNADIDVSVTDSDDPVDEGDEVTYRITLDNNDNRDVTINVRATLDDGMSFLDASSNGDLDGDEVVWDDVEIGEDRTKVLTLRVRINSRADRGDTLRLDVEAGDGNDTETTHVRD